VDGSLNSTDAHNKCAAAACERHQISQRQRTAWRRRVGCDERSVASSMACTGGSLSPTNSTAATNSARRASFCSSEDRRSCGAAGRSPSTEHWQACGCADFEQQVGLASLDVAPQWPQQCLDPRSRPVDSHVPVAGATPMRVVAAINTSDRILLAGRNMVIPVEFKDTSIILPRLTFVKPGFIRPRSVISSAAWAMPARGRFVVCRVRLGCRLAARRSQDNHDDKKNTPMNCALEHRFTSQSGF